MRKLKNITRREFIAGVSVMGLASGMPNVIGKPLFRSTSEFIYPPLRDGMRGSHKGSFEVAHDLAWNSIRPDDPKTYTDTDYDLVIMGAGISGLTSAWLARKKLGPNARILILDNHDDFGGHAKRNEFDVDGKRMIGYGGSQSIASPGKYSHEAHDILKSLGIITKKFYQYFDNNFYEQHGMGEAIHFSKKDYGKNHLAKPKTKRFLIWETPDEKEIIASAIKEWPLSDESKASLHKLLIDREDWCERAMPNASVNEKRKVLKQTSYKEALIKFAGLTEEAYGIFNNDFVGMWGIDWEGLSAMTALLYEHLAISMVDLEPSEEDKKKTDNEPFIFHFPDGNASIVRLLIRDLIPDSVKANTMEEMVTAHFDYNQLDEKDNNTKIRLNSTVIEAKNNGNFVDVTYVRDGKAEKVRSQKSILAGYSHILPFIMPEMGENQREAIEWAEKTPLVYTNVALTNWRAWEKAGIRSFENPKGFFNSISLDFPVSMGGVQFSASSDEPIIVHLGHYPTRPGLTQREQHLRGRRDLYKRSFEEFEEAIIHQLTEALGPYGFDAEKDIAGITVNRWPHGYAFEYNELFDDPSFGPYHGSAGGPDKGPHVLGRKTIGNIAIAGSDASAYAYINGAMDAAILAVKELWG